MQEFVNFFSSLFAPIPSYDESDLDFLLLDLPIPKLSENDSSILEAKITVKQIQQAIFAFPPHKAPGPDGLPADFYKINVETLAPRINLLLYYCHEHATLPDSMLEA